MNNPAVQRIRQLLTEESSNVECDVHEGQRMYTDPITLLITCPQCFKEKIDKELEKETNEWAKSFHENEKYNVFKLKSILSKDSIKESRFNNFEVVKGSDMDKNVQNCIQAAKKVISGEIFNLILEGNTGLGKSHLSYAMLNMINESSNKQKSCLFVDLDKAMRMVKDSFSSKSIELEIINLMSDVDVLVIDDLGAENGNIDTQKVASDYNGGFIKRVMENRDNKVTIYTTNLNDQRRSEMYDAKTLSRLYGKHYKISFVGSNDKRVQRLEF